MKLAYQYDTDGLLVEAVYLENQDPISANCTALPAGITVTIMQLRLTIPLIFIFLCHLINNERKNKNWSINY